ncbi:MAG: aldo/keto reductase [Sutterella wadsworthensis]
MPTDSTLENAVSAALKLGYRFFDTAQIYGNASAIGRGVLLSDLPRAEIFISSKIWTSHRSYDGVMRAFTDIIEQLKTTYLDQLLIHWPAAQGRAHDLAEPERGHLARPRRPLRTGARSR